MAFSGKKGKKKGIVISLQSFLANGDVPVGTTQVAKKVRNLEGEESDDGMNAMPLVLELPTAPRANRFFDDDYIPHNPPYIAYITNLPFDAKEDDLHEFFGTTPIISLRLPREEGETGRVRGFGYVEFEHRDDLINTLSLPDPSVKGRRIRIELSNESEHQGFRQKGNRRGFDGFNNSGENRESSNWRRDNVNNSNGSFDRSISRGKKYELDDNKPIGSWRSGVRTNINHNTDLKFRNKDAEKIMSNYFKRDDQELERPKLNLKPRTLPLPFINKESDTNIEKHDDNTQSSEEIGITLYNVFGSAKPVDTATRELEIEERMSEARRQQQLKHEIDESSINEKIGVIQLENTYNDNTKYAASWRRRDDLLQNNDNNSLSGSPDGIEEQKNDNYREENHQTKSRDNIDRVYKSISLNRDAKHKDENKYKRMTKSERIFSKHQETDNAPGLQTFNKYSGLDDGASD